MVYNGTVSLSWFTHLGGKKYCDVLCQYSVLHILWQKETVSVAGTVSVRLYYKYVANTRNRVSEAGLASVSFSTMFVPQILTVFFTYVYTIKSEE